MGMIDESKMNGEKSEAIPGSFDDQLQALNSEENRLQKRLNEIREHRGQIRVKKHRLWLRLSRYGE